MSREVRQLYDGLEKAVIVRHVGEFRHHGWRHGTAAREVDRMSVADQAARGGESGQVAMKTVAVILRHPAKVAIPRITVCGMEYRAAQPCLPRLPE